MAWRTNCNASLRISNWTSSYVLYWELHVLYNLPPPNCWSWLLLWVYLTATLFPTIGKLNTPNLLFIPYVTLNWRQNTVLLWLWPVIAISDWSSFQVHFLNHKIYFYQSFAPRRCLSIDRSVKLLLPQDPFVSFRPLSHLSCTLYLPKHCPPRSPNIYHCATRDFMCALSAPLTRLCYGDNTSLCRG